MRISNNSSTCKVCSSTVQEYLSVFDDRYGYPGQFKIVECSRCSHKFLLGDFAPELLTTLYTDFYPRSTLSLDQYRPAKEITGCKSWLNGESSSTYCWVPKNVRILDIGCGFGESLGYHTTRGCDVYGVEADENIRRVADKFGFKVHVGLFDPNLYDANFFDYVTMNQVIEHVADPLLTMRGIEKVLKRGGVAVLSTPNANGWGVKVFGRRWINWHAPYHQQFFTVESIKRSAEQAGLVLDKVKTITSSEWLFYQWLHLATYPRIGQPSAFWSPRGYRGFKVKLFFAVLLMIHYTKINHVITRVFDTLGIGDNYLLVLRKP